MKKENALVTFFLDWYEVGAQSLKVVVMTMEGESVGGSGVGGGNKPIGDTRS